ncbi:acyl-CoA dehydrogenase family protein [Herbiconiux sp. SYSU D00978]|uniref:acyl-CoA dehydrogenase family protein n=1 Tax=Herbiconiux sp. SYSU D00978 TaxID=2812562 RepID=UPI001A97A0D3|nr:acyl-CoA dehydrogenase family protein [Herbiconiux sp. SYSU D00978]
MTSPETPIITDGLLDSIRSRAAFVDSGNVFPHDDLADLAEVGYLRMFVPVELGGHGFGLERVAREQVRLATAAPATALAVNMHLIWTGVAKALRDRGDSSLEWVLTDAAQGEIFAFGVSEPGNDLVLFDSVTRAEPVGDGGFAFTGTKIFTSLSPVWTRLSVFGKDESGDTPALVHGFLTRDDAGVSNAGDWDTLGMRGTQSHTTRLDGAVVPASRIFRRLPVGPNPDPLIFGIFANFLPLIASVYVGIAERALELAVAAAKRRTSLKAGGASYAEDPDIRWRVADAALALDALYAPLFTIARDVDSLANHGAAWFPKLVGVKIRSTETARVVVDQAIRVSGGSSYANSSELSRLYRDVLAGIFHPSDAESAHNTIANYWLGPLPS